MSGSQLSLEERFLARVNKSGPVPAHRPYLGKCWVWTGSKQESKPGFKYGIISEDGSRKNWRRATHIAWLLHYGEELPNGLNACHKCDNTLCVRWFHLFSGTQKDNMQDAKEKGRLPKRDHHGENHPGWGTKRNAEQRERFSAAQADRFGCIYILETPEGRRIRVKNLRAWCRHKGFNNANVYKLFNGKAQTAYGYRGIRKEVRG